MMQKKHDNEEENFTVAGYTFTTKEAADDARNEMNAIRYVSSKTDRKDPKQIYILYNTMLDKELFKTPVGLDYLKDLQQYLYNNKDIPIINIALVIVVIAMAVIMATSQTPTIINYENKIQDKYAGWEEELQSREAQVKQLEQQYKK